MSPKPFLKWAGGKTQLLPELLKHIPTTFDIYYEPFIGGGALLFELKPRKAVIADVNFELINCYKCIRNELDLILAHIDSFPVNSDFFYELRSADRDLNFALKSNEWKAARIIYLNKTCFNGLYRVNTKGEFNAPWGNYSNPKIYDWENLLAVNSYLFLNQVSIKNCSFHDILKEPAKDDFVYCDPPYDVLSDTSNFTGYSQGGFTRANQKCLKEYMDALTDDGVKVLQSNADTPFIRALYSDYNIVEVQAKRSINSKGDKRGDVTELLIKNY